MRDLYEVLSVAKDATKEEIRIAWIKSSKENHPDNGGDTAKQAEVNQAYEILYDDEKRERYDKTGTIKEDSFEKRFYAIMNPLVAAVSDTINPEKTDFVSELVSNILNVKGVSEQQLHTLDKRIKNTQNILKRIKSDGSGKLEQVLNLQLAEAEKSKILVEEDLNFLNKTLDILDKYGYDFEEADVWVHRNTGGIRFRLG